MTKIRIFPDLPKFLDRIFAIHPKIFLQLKSLFIEQILFLLIFPENFESPAKKFVEDMNRSILKKIRFEKIAV